MQSSRFVAVTSGSPFKSAGAAQEKVGWPYFNRIHAVVYNEKNCWETEVVIVADCSCLSSIGLWKEALLEVFIVL